VFVIIFIYSLLHLECHISNLKGQLSIEFSMSLSPRSVAKRQTRWRLKNEIECHSKCNRLYIHIYMCIYLYINTSVNLLCMYIFLYMYVYVLWLRIRPCLHQHDLTRASHSRAPSISFCLSLPLSHVLSGPRSLLLSLVRCAVFFLAFLSCYSLSPMALSLSLTLSLPPPPTPSLSAACKKGSCNNRLIHDTRECVMCHMSQSPHTYTTYHTHE